MTPMPVTEYKPTKRSIELESWERVTCLGTTALENVFFNENIDVEG